MTTTNPPTLLAKAQREAVATLKVTLVKLESLDEDRRIYALDYCTSFLDKVSLHTCTSGCHNYNICHRYWELNEMGKLSMVTFGDVTYYVHNSTLKALDKAGLPDLYDIYNEAFPS